MVAPLFTHHFGDTSYNLYTIFLIGLQEDFKSLSLLKILKMMILSFKYKNRKVVVLTVSTTTLEEKSSFAACAS